MRYLRMMEMEDLFRLEISPLLKEPMSKNKI